MDEEIVDIPENDKETDAFFRAKIQREEQGETFLGQVVDIEQGKVTKYRLYFIKYEDDDVERFTGEQVREMMVTDVKDEGEPHKDATVAMEHISADSTNKRT